MNTAASRRERLHLWLLFLGASFVYGLYAVAKHDRFMTSGYDLGIFDQHLWRASHGLPLANTVRELPHLWGDHFHPLFLLLTPLYWFGDGVANLLVAQGLIVCSAAFPIYRYARKRLEHAPALLLVAGFLVSWPIGQGLGFDVHDLALTVPALAWAILLFEERRYRLFWIAVVAVLLTREDQSLTVAMFGFLALWRKEWRLGAALLLVGFAWIALAMRWIVPYFADGSYSHWTYSHLAPDAPALLLLFLTRPWVLLQNLVVPFTKVALVRRFFEPGLFLGLASPIAVLAVPGIALRLLSKNPSHWEPLHHYGMPTAAIVACATIDACGRGLPLVRRVHRARVARWGAAVLFAASLLAAALVPQKSLLLPSFWRDNPQREAGRRAIALVPPEVPVVASARALPHLTHRREAYPNWGYYRDFPQTWTPSGEISLEAKLASYRRADWIVLDAFESKPEDVEVANAMPEFERVLSESGWTVYRRR